jgi:hypothetical protein
LDEPGDQVRIVYHDPGTGTLEVVEIVKVEQLMRVLRPSGAPRRVAAQRRRAVVSLRRASLVS